MAAAAEILDKLESFGCLSQMAAFMVQLVRYTKIVLHLTRHS